MATVADADLVHRLGMAIHAAFLYAGFVPYGVQPPSSGHLLRQSTSESGTSLCVCRWYTSPHLAHRKHAEAAVLILCAAQGSRDVALAMFLTKARDMRGAYLKRLDVATLTQSGTEAGTFPNISWALAKGVCRGLFDQLRQRNGPAVTGFRSLPDDAKVEIFMRLRSAADLAMVECTCRDLRRVVAEHDGELWRRMYMCCSQSAPSRKRMWCPSVSWEDLMFIDKAVRRTQRFCRDEFEAVYERVQDHCQWRWFVPVDVRSSDEGLLSWKEKYLLARNRLCEGCLIPSPGVPLLSWTLCDPPKLEGDETGKIFVGQQQKVPRTRSAYNEKRDGRRGAGTTHSSSSRYRWCHR